MTASLPEMGTPRSQFKSHRENWRNWFAPHWCVLVLFLAVLTAFLAPMPWPALCLEHPDRLRDGTSIQVNTYSKERL